MAGSMAPPSPTFETSVETAGLPVGQANSLESMAQSACTNLSNRAQNHM